MQFGRVYEDLAGIDFTLPPDGLINAFTLADAQPFKDFKALVGCTKWTVKEWSGFLFPPGTKQTNMLPLYAEQFNAIEFGPTFYTICNADYLASFREKVSGNTDFKFCPKFAQTITHIKRLKNAEDDTRNYLKGIDALKPHLGPSLLQLGDNFTPKQFTDLQNYLEFLPRELDVVLEIRHKDWFEIETNRSALFDLMANLKIGSVITDSPGRRDCVHMELPTPHAYIRFVGNNLHPTDLERVDDWINRLKNWKERGLKSVTFFVHQDDERTSVQLCDYFITRLNEQLGTMVKRPKLSTDLFS